MKKGFLLSLLAVAMLTANAQVKRLVYTEQFTITTDENGNETRSSYGPGATNYYDAAGQLCMDQNSYSRNFYEYNADGTVAKKTGYSWSTTAGWELSSYSSYTYEYDSDGNLLKQISTTGSYTQYSGYEHGEYSKMENVDASGNVFYSVSYVNTFDAAGRLIQKDQMTTPDAEGNSYAFIRITRTYNADGTLATENQNYLNADGTPMESNWYKNVYYYNADGTLDHYRQQSNSRYGELTYDYVYTYATYDAAYVVKNVKAEAGANNTVKVSWDALSGATGYNLIFDQQVVPVEGTEYTTESLLDGTHDFYVQAVIGGEGKNISAAAAAEVKDAGKLPAQNFTILSVEEGETSWGSVAYNVTVQFSLPETSSTITGYKLCYGEGNYDNASISEPTIENGVVTATVQLGQYAVSDYDYDLYEYVPRSEVALNVIITYATGDAERSNTKSWNFAANEPVADPEPSPYDIDGDGKFTISDITKLINIYMGGE